ncbi:hypothetical protein F5Y00DRAFT_12179 [Daldinia vernicosa]|uniref:uncharacterized protein n=1 Tax=Daldinia vernicosa TaxID=114800 RepID=UPI0020089EF9|nr:uncharacterized protein F5Y00DRAFT_12179 [Daldinia vernicosa]KAI0851535.1 hypothetical protein F5Y00DRAFT_12179 [Daldinia vernicosa]
MIVARWTFGAILAATAASASTDELQFFARLLKRQDPGSPSYNCHDNCGQAIIQGRNSEDVCNDDIFLADYKACLQCAGPDNEDIWQYYGNALTKSASSCGLSTSPLSGEQPDVGPAVPAGSSSATSASESASPTASATATSKSEASETEAPTLTEVPTETPTGAPTETPTEAPTEVSTFTGFPTETPTFGSSTQEVTPTESAPASSVTESASATSASYTALTTNTPTGTSSGYGNGTAPTSSGVVVADNGANSFSGSAIGFYGALALGALYAVAQ